MADPRPGSSTIRAGVPHPRWRRYRHPMHPGSLYHNRPIVGGMRVKRRLPSAGRAEVSTGRTLRPPAPQACQFLRLVRGFERERDLGERHQRIRGTGRERHDRCRKRGRDPARRCSEIPKQERTATGFTHLEPLPRGDGVKPMSPMGNGKPRTVADANQILGGRDPCDRPDRYGACHGLTRGIHRGTFAR